MNNLKGNPSTPLFPVPISPSVPERLSRLSGSVKMADCIRVPLILLVMCIFSLAHQARGGENNGVGRVGAIGDNPANLAAGPGPGANQGVAERNQAAGASLSRRRSTGWKLSDEAVCREDLTRRCPKHSWNNNLAVLECLQDKKEVN